MAYMVVVAGFLGVLSWNAGAGLGRLIQPSFQESDDLVRFPRVQLVLSGLHSFRALRRALAVQGLARAPELLDHVHHIDGVQHVRKELLCVVRQVVVPIGE